jgi:hypothetical protein
MLPLHFQPFSYMFWISALFSSMMVGLAAKNVASVREVPFCENAEVDRWIPLLMTLL